MKTNDVPMVPTLTMVNEHDQPIGFQANPARGLMIRWVNGAILLGDDEVQVLLKYIADNYTNKRLITLS